MTKFEDIDRLKEPGILNILTLSSGKYTNAILSNSRGRLCNVENPFKECILGSLRAQYCFESMLLRERFILRKTDVSLVYGDRDFRVEVRDVIDGVICRAIVDYQKLKILKTLGENGIDAGFDILLTVPDDDSD